MIILGLDPGIAKFGYGVLQKQAGKLTFEDAGVITTPANTPTSERLLALSRELREVFHKHSPERAVIERLVPGPERNLGVVAEARGVALLLLGEFSVPYTEESPKVVKSVATRHGAATKMQIRRTVQKLLGMDELPPADAADALALAMIA